LPKIGGPLEPHVGLAWIGLQDNRACDGGVYAGSIDGEFRQSAIIAPRI
jgi:hypothetical protein